MVYDERGNNIISLRRAWRVERREREKMMDDGLVPLIVCIVWLSFVFSPAFSTWQ
jgi:hypothetical protein